MAREFRRGKPTVPTLIYHALRARGPSFTSHLAAELGIPTGHVSVSLKSLRAKGRVTVLGTQPSGRGSPRVIYAALLDDGAVVESGTVQMPEPPGPAVDGLERLRREIELLRVEEQVDTRGAGAELLEALYGNRGLGV